MLNNVEVLAAGNFLEETARYLNRSSSYRENMLFLIFAGVIAAIWIALILWERHRIFRPTAPAPLRSLFEELCQTHRLGPQEASLLTDAAQECRLAGPALLFVQPEHLDRLSGEGLPKAASYRELHQRLFGNL